MKNDQKPVNIYLLKPEDVVSPYTAFSASHIESILVYDGTSFKAASIGNPEEAPEEIRQHLIKDELLAAMLMNEYLVINDIDYFQKAVLAFVKGIGDVMEDSNSIYMELVTLEGGTMILNTEFTWRGGGDSVSLDTLVPSLGSLENSVCEVVNAIRSTVIHGE